SPTTAPAPRPPASTATSSSRSSRPRCSACCARCRWTRTDLARPKTALSLSIAGRRSAPMASAGTPKYWFPAKRYGWGWGPPSAWQGWVVLVAYVALILGGIPFVLAAHGRVAFVVYVVVLTMALVAICWRTGERPPVALGWTRRLTEQKRARDAQVFTSP